MWLWLHTRFGVSLFVKTLESLGKGWLQCPDNCGYRGLPTGPLLLYILLLLLLSMLCTSWLVHTIGVTLCLVCLCDCIPLVNVCYVVCVDLCVSRPLWVLVLSYMYTLALCTLTTCMDYSCGYCYLFCRVVPLFILIICVTRVVVTRLLVTYSGSQWHQVDGWQLWMLLTRSRSLVMRPFDGDSWLTGQPWSLSSWCNDFFVCV